MKKIIAGILSVLILASAAFGLVGCKKEKETTSMKNWGAITSIGGAIAETENYLYYINGIGTSTEDNTFGKPVKGALMVVDKSTIGTDNVKTEIVVPKLFVASDYKAGVYLFGEGENTYVYYATPSTSKDSSGNVAKGSLTFARTKLNGTGTEEFTTISGIGSSYRMAEKDGEVYILYFDQDNNELVSYNTAKKEKIVIAKIDDKTTTLSTLPGGSKGYLSLLSYRFIDNGYNTQVVFNMTVYAENYYADKAENQGEDYARATEKYNVMYAYSVGDSKDASGVYGKIIKSGEEDFKTYEFVLVEDGYVFYTEKELEGKTKTYALSANDIYGTPTLIKNPEYVKALIVIVSLDEVYYNDSDKLVVYRTTLTGDDAKVKTTVVPGDKVSSLLFVHDGAIYYYAKNAKIARYDLGADAREEFVTADITSTTWYEPQIININGTDYLFYLDTTTVGSSYFRYVNIDNDAVLNEGEDEEDDADDYYELEGHTFLGQMLVKDSANKAISLLEKMPSTSLEYEVDENGVLTFTALAEAKAELDKLSKESKEFIEETLMEKVAKTEKAQKLARFYYALKDYKNYESMSEGVKEDFKKAYEEAKAYRTELINEKDSQYTAIREMLKDDLKSFYQEAAKIFEK